MTETDTQADPRGSQTFVPGMPDSTECQGEAGTSTGVNLSPGSDDDGWTVPHPVKLGDGTRVQLYKDGEALHAAYEAIKRAKQRICLEVYIWAEDDTGRAFADLLCQRAADGVRIYVIYDSLGSVATDRAIFKKMRRAGVNIHQFHPIYPWECRYSWRPWNRDHRKLLLIDNDIAGMGGLNVGAEYAGSWVIQSGHKKCEFWRDNAIGIVGPGAIHFQRAFANSWNYVTRGGRVRKAELNYNLDFTEGDLAVLGTVPTRSCPLVPFLQGLVNRATHSIDLTMAYFAPPDGLINSLCRAARRGARVRLMLPSKTDVPLLMVAARSFYEKLMSAGVEIYERQGVVLHAKTLVVDRQITIIGSTNLDYRSIEYNLELSAVIRSKQFGTQACNLFEHDMRFARRISLRDWRRRPWVDQFGQWAVSRARYLL